MFYKLHSTPSVNNQWNKFYYLFSISVENNTNVGRQLAWAGSFNSNCLKCATSPPESASSYSLKPNQVGDSNNWWLTTLSGLGGNHFIIKHVFVFSLKIQAKYIIVGFNACRRLNLPFVAVYVLHLFNTYYQYLTYNCFTVNIILLESSIVIMLFITITKIYNFITITKIYYFITLP